MFVHRLRKYAGVYLAVLGRTDVVTFTAGIGEYAAAVRRDAPSGPEALGIELDERRNAQPGNDARRISADSSPVAVLVAPTNEELAIARDCVTVVSAIPGIARAEALASPRVTATTSGSSTPTTYSSPHQIHPVGCRCLLASSANATRASSNAAANSGRSSRFTRSTLIIMWKLLNDPAARFPGLGADYRNTWITAGRRTCNYVAQLMAMGCHVTLEPAAGQPHAHKVTWPRWVAQPCPVSRTIPHDCPKKRSSVGPSHRRY